MITGIDVRVPAFWLHLPVTVSCSLAGPVKGEDPLLDEGPYADDSLAEGDISFYARPDKRAVVWLRPMKPPSLCTLSAISSRA